jgi:hypothetical protein
VCEVEIEQVGRNFWEKPAIVADRCCYERAGVAVAMEIEEFVL